GGGKLGPLVPAPQAGTPGEVGIHCYKTERVPLFGCGGAAVGVVRRLVAGGGRRAVGVVLDGDCTALSSPGWCDLIPHNSMRYGDAVGHSQSDHLTPPCQRAIVGTAPTRQRRCRVDYLPGTVFRPGHPAGSSAHRWRGLFADLVIVQADCRLLAAAPG